jgi:2,3,4,5-tetrahydropyridine-2-carboxylate N-succinyltransferase
LSEKTIEKRLRRARRCLDLDTRGEIRDAVETSLNLLDSGKVRVAESRRMATGRSTSG